MTPHVLVLDGVRYVRATTESVQVGNISATIECVGDKPESWDRFLTLVRSTLSVVKSYKPLEVTIPCPTSTLDPTTHKEEIMFDVAKAFWKTLDQNEQEIYTRVVKTKDALSDFLKAFNDYWSGRLTDEGRRAFMVEYVDAKAKKKPTKATDLTQRRNPEIFTPVTNTRMW